MFFTVAYGTKPVRWTLSLRAALPSFGLFLQRPTAFVRPRSIVRTNGLFVYKTDPAVHQTESFVHKTGSVLPKTDPALHKTGLFVCTNETFVQNTGSSVHKDARLVGGLEASKKSLGALVMRHLDRMFFLWQHRPILVL
jgi:hypothetical protein